MRCTLSASSASPAIEAWQDYVKAETLSDELRFGAPEPGMLTEEDSLDGMRLTLGVKRVARDT